MITYKKKAAILMSAMFAGIVNVHANKMADYASYCNESGGLVEKMPAELATGNGIVEGQSKLFCTFSPDHGFISIGLETFAALEPSIAATYMKKLSEIGSDSPLWEGKYTNPSANVCKNLGGASIGFVTSGGFANYLGQTDMCVFGDASMVSAWSLIYMANHREGYDEVKNKVKSEPLNIYIPQ